MRLRALAGRFLFMLVVLAALLLILEVVLRTTHLLGARISWSVPDPVITWRFAPDCEYWNDQENDHPIVGKINGHGWRDRERSLTKPAGTYRLAVLGDSFVEAFQVELDSTFAAITERHFATAAGLGVEVLNFGRSGMTQTEEYLILQSDVLTFSPDLVVLFFLPRNDIVDVSRKTASSKLRPFYTVADSGELVLDTSFTESRSYRMRTLVPEQVGLGNRLPSVCRPVAVHGRKQIGGRRDARRLAMGHLSELSQRSPGFTA